MARFVLVHGAFGGAWCWQPVVAALEAAGHTADALDLPGGGDDRTPVEEITLEACADRVRETLDSRPEDAVLVAHSMGGVVATQAAGSGADGISRLIFVAAFMPANGQSLLDLTQYPEGANDMIQANISVDGDPPVATLPDTSYLHGQLADPNHLRVSDEQHHPDRDGWTIGLVDEEGTRFEVELGTAAGGPRSIRVRRHRATEVADSIGESG